MRSFILRKRTLFLTGPPRWKKRLVYFFAFFGAAAFSGLTFIVYLSLQVPEDQINAGIPFPKLANTVQKTEPIPDVKKSAAVPFLAVGAVPAYALFYTTKSPEGEPSKPRTLNSRHRSKPVKRSPGVVKAKRPS
jgi:hypothetical protein